MTCESGIDAWGRVATLAHCPAGRLQKYDYYGAQWYGVHREVTWAAECTYDEYRTVPEDLRPRHLRHLTSNDGPGSL